ncbi:GNAT family N-acetyltransferase [Neobacillus notoginsengisoli]|uniref:GNAT family N-acetyltransferase n=1 Tax=Neobacillus notoginsengisoli TaxID=1578198 RepID=A0A417YS23_9BACI|nr:GNAT family N-acetyltransferase [Neobacillus notoginsengisoli]RHW38103.1 GNAT family N-acetyltransferase [Neobacillus notoginsengisoli]
MEIRRIVPEDAEQYRRLRLDALKEHPEAFAVSYEEERAYPLDFFKERFSEDNATTFGAFDGEKLAGVVTLVREAKSKLSHRANIFAMYVAPEYRRAGVGKKLLAEAIRKAKQLEGVTHLYLSVTSTNLPAKKLYESIGFTTYGIDRHALKIGGQVFSEDLMSMTFPVE